ncbi:MAG: IclR family transcriptional regulator [Chloroflexota bacterium]|nr:MAG: IclR family transcriptional regulator [Chloroflexota bacterium]
MSNDMAKSASRAFEILDCFIRAGSDLGVSEISRQLRCSKSMVHRLLVSLEAAGYVSADPNSHRYRLGFKAIQLGLAAQRQVEVRSLARPVMQRLRDLTRETVTLSLLLADQSRVYLEQIESPQEIRQTVELGGRYPLFFGSSGKSILAFLPEERQEQILAGAVGRTRADGWPLDLAALRQDLDRVRSQGFACSLSERILGAASVAAPIFNHAREVVGCLSIAGPAVRLTTERMEQFAPLAAAAAAEVSRDLGFVSADDLAPVDVVTAAG